MGHRGVLAAARLIAAASPTAAASSAGTGSGAAAAAATAAAAAVTALSRAERTRRMSTSPSRRCSMQKWARVVPAAPKLAGLIHPSDSQCLIRRLMSPCCLCAPHRICLTPGTPNRAAVLVQCAAAHCRRYMLTSSGCLWRAQCRTRLETGCTYEAMRSQPSVTHARLLMQTSPARLCAAQYRAAPEPGDPNKAVVMHPSAEHRAVSMLTFPERLWAPQYRIFFVPGTPNEATAIQLPA